MRVHQASFSLSTNGPGTYEITDFLAKELDKSGLKSGIATIFCPHTSCSLVAMENASPEARRDLQTYLNRLVPPRSDFEHNLEGADDMPSHIKMALTRTSETIPFDQGALLLGSWQGLFLWEHRVHPHRRTIRVTLLGE